ncbi:MAG: T9SS type A sorting domain-containing protein [Bacteroidota bacterium]|nr:T9SS type A sorting domain-containing protein [Bacteroidota bacterium]
MIWPNPVARLLQFNEVIDVAIYDTNGKRMKVARNINNVDVSDLTPGIYILKTFNARTEKSGTSKIIIESGLK